MQKCEDGWRRKRRIDGLKFCSSHFLWLLLSSVDAHHTFSRSDKFLLYYLHDDKGKNMRIKEPLQPSALIFSKSVPVQIFLALRLSFIFILGYEYLILLADDGFVVQVLIYFYSQLLVLLFAHFVASHA